jgi:hypothetical protein
MNVKLNFSFQMKEIVLLISINRVSSAEIFSIKNLANSQIWQMDWDFRDMPKDFLQRDIVKKIPVPLAVD